mgnify:CR=1 FL=1
MQLIKFKNKLLGIIIRDSYYKEGPSFFTNPNCAFQVGMLVYPQGHKIKPHRHRDLKVVREEPTQEVLYVKKGKVAVFFYVNKNMFFCKKVIKEGDLLILLSGAHGFKFLERSQLI